MQEGDDGKEYVIHYLSQQLNATQQKWCTLDKECYALELVLKKFRQYLLGDKFVAYTDHKPLKSLFTAEMKNARVQQCGILINEYLCDIQSRPGRTMKADFVSRLHAQTTPKVDTHVSPTPSDTFVHQVTLDCDYGYRLG